MRAPAIGIKTVSIIGWACNSCKLAHTIKIKAGSDLRTMRRAIRSDHKAIGADYRKRCPNTFADLQRHTTIVGEQFHFVMQNPSPARDPYNIDILLPAPIITGGEKQ